jgi:Amino acid permease
VSLMWCSTTHPKKVFGLDLVLTSRALSVLPEQLGESSRSVIFYLTTYMRRTQRSSCGGRSRCRRPGENSGRCSYVATKDEATTSNDDCSWCVIQSFILNQVLMMYRWKYRDWFICRVWICTPQWRPCRPFDMLDSYGSHVDQRHTGKTAMIYFHAIINLIVQALGEMAILFPVSGGFYTLSGRFLDPSFAFAMGWNYVFQWAIVLPLEITVAGTTVQYWTHKVPIAAWITVFWVAIGNAMSCIAQT